MVYPVCNFRAMRNLCRHELSYMMIALPHTLRLDLSPYSMGIMTWAHESSAFLQEILMLTQTLTT